MSDVKKKDTVRISKKDLLRILAENIYLTEQLAELQQKYDALMAPTEEDLSEGAPEDWGPGPGRSPDPNDPLPADIIHGMGNRR